LKFDFGPINKVPPVAYRGTETGYVVFGVGQRQRKSRQDVDRRIDCPTFQHLPGRLESWNRIASGHGEVVCCVERVVAVLAARNTRFLQLHESVGKRVVCVQREPVKVTRRQVHLQAGVVRAAAVGEVVDGPKPRIRGACAIVWRA
jgi:hypothetical protein